MFDYLGQVNHAALGNVLKQADRPGEEGEVDFDQLANGEVLDLDHHFGPVVEVGPVALTDRSRGEGMFFKVGKQLC